MSSVTTHDTTELGLTLSVTAFCMPAGTTALAGVPRVYQSDRHPRQPRLVADELPQLAEGPIAVSCPSRFPNRCPLADMGQILQGNRALRVFGFLDKLGS